MIKAILLDLDDTLLGNRVDTFLPPYFKLLGQYASSLIPQEKFIPLLLACTQETVNNRDVSLTNFDVFWSAFVRETGIDAQETEAFFEQFYRTEFSALQTFTQPRPCAPHLVQHCLDRGFQVVVATNPLFPRTAIEQRLTWAGVPSSEFAYALVTTMENMHATKPHEAYYQEILGYLNCSAEEVLMVGDSWENDIFPASAVGMKTFWIPANETVAEDESLLLGAGSLDAFYGQLKSGLL